MITKIVTSVVGWFGSHNGNLILFTRMHLLQTVSAYADH